MATQFARRLGLLAFAMATLQGLLGGADFFGTIQTALVMLAALYLLGLFVGDIARRIVEESVAAESRQPPGAPKGASPSARPV